MSGSAQSQRQRQGEIHLEQGENHLAARAYGQPLYTPEQRVKRDNSRWTLVQGILAPLQFLVFMISLALVFRTLATGEGYALATSSIILKTIILYIIMVTGAIWEKVVFGQYLLAPAFFWEDVFSFLVLALHTAYLLALWGQWLSPTALLWLALAAYAAYVINAVQFILKLRAARLDAARLEGNEIRENQVDSFSPQPDLGPLTPKITPTGATT